MEFQYENKLNGWFTLELEYFLKKMLFYFTIFIMFVILYNFQLQYHHEKFKKAQLANVPEL